MGVGNSKVQNKEENGENLQAPLSQTSMQDVLKPAPSGMLDGTYHPTKRPRDLESDDGESNKKLKTFDSGDSVLQQVSPSASVQNPLRPSLSQQILHQSEEHTILTTETSAREDVDQADNVHESGPYCDADLLPLSQNHDAIEHQDILDVTPETSDEVQVIQDPPSSTADTLSHSSPVASRHTENELPGRGGTVSPCASPSELSQQMESQLSQASQAVVEAAAASQDHENAVLSGWKRASESISSPKQREHNRLFLRDATHALHSVEHSQAFSSDGLSQSATSSGALQRLLGQTPYLRCVPRSADDASEVAFVTELSQGRRRCCESRWERRVSKILTMDIPDTSDNVETGVLDSIVPRAGERGRQRKLVGYWRGWEEGIFSRQALL